MNVNLLIEFAMIATVIVFLISIFLLIYYSVKAGGLIKPISLNYGNNYAYTDTEHKIFIHNNRLRNKNETIFDSVVSEKADFTKYSEGQTILEAIRDFK